MIWIMAVYNIYYSPTGGTKKVSDIISGMLSDSCKEINLMKEDSFNCRIHGIYGNRTAYLVYRYCGRSTFQRRNCDDIPLCLRYGQKTEITPKGLIIKFSLRRLLFEKKQHLGYCCIAEAV